jgi:spermidine/putrescine transport system ATP-binding protein
MQLELKRLQTEVGITFVYVTHDQEEALTMSDRIAVMAAGRLLQVGTPTEIYERPATRFVADFIGETNFLDGEIQDIAAGRATVLLAGAGPVQIPLADGDGVTAGDRVTIAVRPEKVRLAAANPDGSDPTFALAGTVEELIYLGTDTTYLVRVPGQGTIRARRQNSGPGPEQDLVPGLPVRVGWAPESARLLPA